MNKLKTYGKANRVILEYQKTKDCFRLNPNLNKIGIESYLPKLNKCRLTICIIGIGLCLATPCTNFLIPVVARFGLK